MLHLSDATLRYWEDQFADFSEMKVYHDPQGNRHYSAENIRFIKLIKFLRDEQKITRIEAQKRWLRDNDKKVDIRQRASEILGEVREALMELRAMI